MSKFIFVITSILILSLVACSSDSNSLVGQGVGSDSIKTLDESISLDGKNHVEMLEIQNNDLEEDILLLDQYIEQLRADIDQMQQDLTQELMINDALQEDITYLSNELQAHDQQSGDIVALGTINESTGPTIEELLEAEIITTYIKASLIEIYNNSQGDQVKFMADVEKIISEVNNIILGQGDVSFLDK